MNQDQVILVNEHDQEIGSMDKVAAHRGQAHRHRAISVFLFNEAGELLLQQRSQQKIVGARQWANTVCGNLRPQESYHDCAARRLREELGIQVNKAGIALQPLIKFEYHVACNAEFSEWEIDQVFGGWFTGDPQPNPEEVASTAWVNFENILDLPFDFAPWFKIMMQREEVRAAITQFHNQKNDA